MANGSFSIRTAGGGRVEPSMSKPAVKTFLTMVAELMRE